MTTYAQSWLWHVQVTGTTIVINGGAARPQQPTGNSNVGTAPRNPQAGGSGAGGGWQPDPEVTVKDNPAYRTRQGIAADFPGGYKLFGAGSF